MRGLQVVVTGANGFIGRWLTRELCHRGASVTALSRRPHETAALLPPAVRQAPLDLLDPAALAARFRGADIVFHAAGLYRFGLGHRRALHRANVHGTAAVLEAVRRARVRRLVHLSSAGILEASSRSGGLIGPDDFPARQPAWSAYKASKWASERLVLSAAADGLDAAIASITCPIGAEDTVPTPTGRMLLDFLRGRFPAVARTGLNFIGVRDLADGLIAVADKGRAGRRYILGQENLLLADFLRRAAPACGRPAPTLTIPWIFVAAAGLAGEAAHAFAPGRGRRLCLETALQARRLQFFSLGETADELGWRASRPLDDAIGQAASWFRTAWGLSGEAVPAAEIHVA